MFLTKLSRSFIAKVLMVLLLLAPGGLVLSKAGAPAGCDGVTLEVKVVNSESGVKKGSAEAIVTGASNPVYYIFYKASGELLSENVSSNKVVNIDPGTYYLSIVAGRSCTKKTEFKIE